MVDRGDKFTLRKKEKTIRIEFRIPEWLIPAIEEYQHDNDIHGTRQAVMISMLKYASKINSFKKELRENPELVKKLKTANDNYSFIDMLYDRNNNEREVAVFIDSATKFIEIKRGKTVV